MGFVWFLRADEEGLSALFAVKSSEVGVADAGRGADYLNRKERKERKETAGKRVTAEAGGFRMRAKPKPSKSLTLAVANSVTLSWRSVSARRVHFLYLLGIQGA